MCQAAPLVRRSQPNREGGDPPAEATANPAHLVGGRAVRAARWCCSAREVAPTRRRTERGISNAVVVDGEAYVVDCGEGVHRQLWRAGIAMNRGRVPQDGAAVRALFLTHLHSDHVIDLAEPVPRALAVPGGADLRPRARRAADPDLPARPAATTVVLPGEPDTGHRRHGHQPAGRVRLQHQRPHRRRGPVRSHPADRRERRSASVAMATNPTSTWASRPAERRRRPPPRRWSRWRSTPPMTEVSR